MPHLFSGLNQKRQGGKITNGTILAGNPKTKGSTSRIVSNCQSTSANPSECISQIFAKTNPSNTLSSTGILFDKSTFDDLFDIYGSGMRPLIKPIDTNISVYTLPVVCNTVILLFNGSVSAAELSSTTLV